MKKIVSFSVELCDEDIVVIDQMEFDNFADAVNHWKPGWDLWAIDEEGTPYIVRMEYYPDNGDLQMAWDGKIPVLTGNVYRNGSWIPFDEYYR